MTAEPIRILIGVDDTDNLESRGTGYRARQLGLHVQELGIARLLSVTRHQLLVSPEIRYTSHNSSACLVMDADPRGVDSLEEACQTYLVAESASGSDVGLCVAGWNDLERIGTSVAGFGGRAKKEVLKQTDAVALADGAGLFLVGLTGDHGGVIGALAAVGLRFAGNDGRFLWLPGLRELSGECQTPARLRAEGGVDVVATVDGFVPGDDSVIRTGDWVRPILKDGKAVLLVEGTEMTSGGDCEPRWQVVAKDTIKQLSS